MFSSDILASLANFLFSGWCCRLRVSGLVVSWNSESEEVLEVAIGHVKIRGKVKGLGDVTTHALWSAPCSIVVFYIVLPHAAYVYM
jgi:hypothetical protein